MVRFDQKQATANQRTPNGEFSGALVTNASKPRRPAFTPSEVQAYTELGVILKRIHDRVSAERGAQHSQQSTYGDQSNTTEKN